MSAIFMVTPRVVSGWALPVPTRKRQIKERRFSEQNVEENVRLAQKSRDYKQLRPTRQSREYCKTARKVFVPNGDYLAISSVFIAIAFAA
ncbi:MAG: hypothetical protein Fur0034_17420 [Desulfuromonadia bacterium]